MECQSKGAYMESVNVALIGAGYISDYHARGLLAQPGVKISAVCGLGETAIAAFARKYNIDEYTEDVSTLFGRSDIDAVVISTPNKFHAPYAIDFLNHGKDVFLEKPMAMNPAEGRQIADAVKANKQLVMVGHMWRFDEEVQFLRQVIDEGRIGRIVKTKGYGIHENWGPGGWFVQKELAGGGALADMGVHAIDTVRYLLGDPVPRQVFAKIGTYYGDYDVDDTGIIMVQWDNGTTSVIESGWWHPHMDAPEAGTQLFGTRGYASLFPTLLKFKVAARHGEFRAPMPEKSEHCDQSMYTRQMAYFVQCIRERIQPAPGLAEGQVILDIVDAAYRSAELGQAIDL